MHRTKIFKKPSEYTTGNESKKKKKEKEKCILQIIKTKPDQ